MVAKIRLRKAQRQAYASQRECMSRNIMNASSTDAKLFHYLLRGQRSVDIQHTRLLQYNDQVAETYEDILACGENTSKIFPTRIVNKILITKNTICHIYRMPLYKRMKKEN